MNQLSAVHTGRLIRNTIDIPITIISSRFGNRAKEVERFLKFAIVGVIGAIVDFGTVTLLQATVLPPDSKNGTNVFVATSIAFIAAVCSNFIWNRIWTYPDSRSKSARRQLALFTFISFVGWAGRTLWITASFHAVGSFLMPVVLPIIRVLRPGYIPSFAAQDKLGTLAAMLVGVIVVMFWNFLANRRWTYNDVE
ncbi:MAG: GtrA family protein [Anaerolineae bacterium]